MEVKYNFDNDIQTLTTFNDARDGRIDDGNRHIIDIIFYLKFAKIYLDNKSFGDQVMGKVFPKTDFYIGKENNKNIFCHTTLPSRRAEFTTRQTIQSAWALKKKGPSKIINNEKES